MGVQYSMTIITRLTNLKVLRRVTEGALRERVWSNEHSGSTMGANARLRHSTRVELLMTEYQAEKYHAACDK